MPVPKMQWECNVCSTPHLTEEAATLCEGEHPVRVADIKILEVHYRPRPKKAIRGGLYDYRKGRPDHLKVQYPDGTIETFAWTSVKSA